VIELRRALPRRVEEKLTEVKEKIVETKLDISILSEIVRQLKIISNDPDVWQIVVEDVDTPIAVKKGNTLVIVDERETGKLAAASVTTKDPNTLIDFTIDKMVIKVTPQSLYDDGIIGFNPAYPWLSKYDTDANEYVVWITPVPDRQYQSRIRLTVTPSQDTAITYSCYRYKLR